MGRDGPSRKNVAKNLKRSPSRRPTRRERRMGQNARPGGLGQRSSCACKATQRRLRQRAWSSRVPATALALDEPSASWAAIPSVSLAALGRTLGLPAPVLSQRPANALDLLEGGSSLVAADVEFVGAESAPAWRPCGALFSSTLSCGLPWWFLRCRAKNTADRKWLRSKTESAPFEPAHQRLPFAEADTAAGPIQGPAVVVLGARLEREKGRNQ